MPGQTALLKCFPASTWAGSLMIEGDLLRIDHGLEGVPDPCLGILVKDLFQHPIKFRMLLFHSHGVFKKIL